LIAKAPGKLVLSGAYSVLEGAPALVFAVGRYAVADSDRPAERVPLEVQAALRAGDLSAPCHLDASALRSCEADGPDRKLGLGSSAALLVATLAARWAADAEALGRPPEASALDRARLIAVGLRAHREAQGGGSGVDVAASVHGGLLVCVREPERGLHVEAAVLPSGISLAVFVAGQAAVTSDLLKKVEALRSTQPVEHGALMQAAAAQAERAARATSSATFIAAVAEQFEALGALGRAAKASIVTPEVAELAALAARQDAAFGPSGAGGGDVALFVGPSAPSPDFVHEAASRGMSALPVELGARGVHLVMSRSVMSQSVMP